MGSAAHPNLLVGGGKGRRLYLIDRGTDNSVMTMGEFHTNTDDVVQELGDAVNGILSAPAYFNGNLYVTSGYNSGPIYEFSINDAQLALDGQTTDGYGDLDGSPVVSANGTANGIVWDLALKANQLRAYSAADLSDEIYNSSTVSADALPSSSILKFSVLTVANGDVYVGTSSSLVMFGLKTPPAAPPAAPSSLAATVTTDATAVSLSWTNNATNPANVSAFEIQRSTDDVNFTQIGTAGESQTTFLDTSVAALHDVLLSRLRRQRHRHFRL